MEKTKILITGGAGFIGSSFVNLAIANNYHPIVIDNLTYSGRLTNLSWIRDFDIEQDFYKGDINDQKLLKAIFAKHKIGMVVHFAAESHVDNSINDPSPFIKTNINGTYNLLQTSYEYYQTLSADAQEQFRFLHISTDEVFGELGETGKFSETSPYKPNSPYSASKAASDHLVRAWHQTYKLPILITNCSNNYGPRQHEEKLIPTIITKAINEETIPIYGDGKNIRDWIYVDDHNHAVLLVLAKGKIGETYCIGVDNEKNNNEIVDLVCSKLDEIKPRKNGQSYKELINYVTDRKGHDRRYAINSSKIEKELGFKANHNFADAIEITISFYL